MTPDVSDRFAYRPDIDGLRAIAVMIVVLFHLGLAGWGGGFLGVDMFFVISGYLITSIIVPKMAAGTFSFGTFYKKRIRRLMPPAFVTIIATFIASAFILDPNDLIAMAKSAIAAIFSVSNILFFTEAGYWDAQSELKPLLHTWSLGVEEQFYLIWPILVLLTWKILGGRNRWAAPRLFLAFGIVTVLCVALSEWILRLSEPAAFYLLPARMFEFSMGATVAFFGQSWIWQRYAGRVLRFLAGLIGLLALIFAIWVYRGHPPFPGANGFLPCAATGLVLLSGMRTETSRGRLVAIGWLLESSPFRWIGQMSYSLYLVHWPVVALMRYEVGLTLTLKHQVLAAGLIAGLTLLLYYGVERRISSRRGQRKPTSRPAGHHRLSNGIILSGLMSTGVFFHAAASSGWTWRYETLSLSPGQIEVGKGKRFSNLQDSCFLTEFPAGLNCDPEASISVLVFGNSHEPDGYTFLEAALDGRRDIQLVRFNQTNQCDYQLEGNRLKIGGRRNDCSTRAERLSDPQVMSAFDAVLYASHRPFEKNKDGSLHLLKRMQAANPEIKILALGGYLRTKADCPRLYNENGDLRDCATSKNVLVSPKTDSSAALRPEFDTVLDHYIDLGRLLCADDVPDDCETRTPGGVPFSYDRHHFSFEFAQYAGRKYVETTPEFVTKFFNPVEKSTRGSP